MRSSDGPATVVIGGGIIGSCIAYERARRHDVVEVLDPAAATGASARNAGILALSYAMPMSNPHSLLAALKSVVGLSHDVQLGRPLDARSLRWMGQFCLACRPGRARRAAFAIYGMARSSVEAYDAFAEREGIDLRFRRNGWLYTARDGSALRRQVALAAVLAEVGIASRVVTERELPDFEPALGPGHLGAVHYPGDISIDPVQVTSAVLGAAQKRGAQLTTDAVVSAEITDGTVRAVRTASGRVVHANRFVVAAGAASHAVGRLFGLRLPVEPGYGWSLTLPTATEIATSALMGIEDHVVINPRPESVRITGGMRFGGMPATRPNPADIAELRHAAQRILPGIAEIGHPGVAEIGARPMTPSGLPIVSRQLGNVFVATGHGTLGMTLAPHTAVAVSDLIDRASTRR